MIVPALGVLAAAALLLLPLAGVPYTTTLLLPAFGYAIALLGLNLLFGSAGLLSFGHALFVALGGYTAAALTSRAGVRSLELLLLAAAVTAALVAVPVGLLCVRYVKIYFGMLTLAFGMLFYSFLYKFYTLTGGDEGMRVLRPVLLGQPLEHLDKVAFLTGPFYYYALGVLLVVPTGLADPLLAYWTHSGNLVFMLLLGGFDHFLGPVLGAVVFILLQDAVMSLTPYWRFVFGAILAVVVIFFPRGLMGLLDARRAPRGVTARLETTA